MKILRDPLVIFLLIGGAIFFLFSKVAPEEAGELVDPNRIEITQDILSVLEAEWAARWNRPPTEVEFKGMVDAYVKEEILFREATKLGLDQSDTIIRRRLAQKMEFLTSDIADLEEVSDESLAAYFEKQADRYRLEPEIGFQQLFFSPEDRGEKCESDAKEVLDALNSGSMTFQKAFEGSDRTLLGMKFPVSAISVIGRQFGVSFSKSLAALEGGPGTWLGPIKSGYGMHIIQINKRVKGGLPPLESVRDKVLADYRYEQRNKLNEEILNQLLENYEVVISGGEPDSEPS